MLPFHKVAESDFLDVNQMIVDRLHSEVELVENIGEYIVDGGGKRLRPLVVLLAALSCGYNGRDHIKLACIIEFIHTATLLHDDVVDTSELRRGRPTANTKWGNSPTVLVGDFLYSRAFQMLVELGNMPIMKLLADTTNAIAEGEVQQLINAGDPNVSEQNYLNVIRKKTAILFGAATSSGALIANQTEAQVRAFADYGQHLGTVFQLQDDVLDYTGDVNTMGKNIGDDLAEGKPTMPLIYAMREADEASARLISRAITNCDNSNIEKIIEVVHSCGGLGYARALAQSEADAARSALTNLPESSYKQALLDLADFALDRNF